LNQSRDIDKEWEEYWRKEGYDLDTVGPAPRKRRAVRNFFKWVDFEASEQEQRDSLITGFTALLKKDT
jgi:hypothetical protein